MEQIKKLIKTFFLALIKIYQVLISPFLGNNCRYYPSCSSYAREAILRFGVIKGCFWACKRILSCHPWHTGGYDPVPQKNNK